MRATVTVLGLAGVLLGVVLPLVAFALYGLGAPRHAPGESALALPVAAILLRLGATLFVGAAVAAGTLAVGLPVALLLERTGRWPGRGAVAALTLAPLAVPPYLHAVAWIGLFAGLGGAGGASASWLFSPAGTILVLVAALWPCAAWGAVAGLRSIDPRLEEAARLAAGRTAALRRVTIPLAARHAAAGALLAAVLAMAETGVPAIFGTPTLAAEVYARFAAFHDAAGALGLALVQVVPVGLVVALLLRLLPRVPSRGLRVAGVTAPMLTAAAFPVLALAAVAGLGGSLVLPLVSFLVGLGPAPGAALAGAWGIASADLGRTLLLAGAGASAATGLALALRLALDRGRSMRPARIGVGAAAFLGFALPGAAVGIGLIAAYNRSGLPGLVYGSAAMVVLAYVARGFWIPWAGLGAGLRAQGPGPVEAARLAGHPWWRVALRVQVPALRAELAAFLALAFLFCMGELGSVLLVHPPGVDVLSWRIFDLVHYAYDATVAALGLMVMAACLAVVALGGWLSGWGDRLSTG